MPKSRGFTLIELMIVVAIIGVLSALAVYGVKRYIVSARTAEAKNNVNAIARAASASYERSWNESKLLPDGGIGASADQFLCGGAPGPAPGTVFAPSIIPPGSKVQPDTKDNVDFNTGDGTFGWRCLRFSITEPVFYQYSYSEGVGSAAAPLASFIGGPTPTNQGFEAAGQSDFDNDGIYSIFSRVGEVSAGKLKLSTDIFIFNEYE